MNGPSTYAEWLVLLDRFRAGDDSVVQAMQGGSVVWTNVVAERWTHQVAGVFEVRLRALSGQLQTGLDRARGDHFTIANALVAARRGSAALRTFASLPCFPDVVRNHLVAELDRWATETQKSLEKSATQIRHDQGKLLKTIRDNPLTAACADHPTSPGHQTQRGHDGLARGRRIIL